MKFFLMLYLKVVATKLNRFEDFSPLLAVKPNILERNFGHLSLVSLHFHCIKTVIPACYPIKLGTSFIGNLFVYARFLLEACRNDDNSP